MDIYNLSVERHISSRHIAFQTPAGAPRAIFVWNYNIHHWQSGLFDWFTRCSSGSEAP